MKTSEAKKITHSLSKPSKMPGWSYGLPAPECKTGSKLRKIKGSTCYNCYAMKGCYVFPDVKAAQYKRLASTKLDASTVAMAAQLNSKKSKWFRWHDSGDVQDLDHLNKIYEVCRLTPETRHWLPTREAWILDHVRRAPDNLIIRFSMPMVDQAPAGSWPNTSTVVTKNATCPAPSQGGKCKECRACWTKSIKNVSYGKH